MTLKLLWVIIVGFGPSLWFGLKLKTFVKKEPRHSDNWQWFKRMMLRFGIPLVLFAAWAAVTVEVNYPAPSDLLIAAALMVGAMAIVVVEAGIGLRWLIEKGYTWYFTYPSAP